jgi:integrase/recombinase XerD
MQILEVRRVKRYSVDMQKIRWTLEWGRQKGQSYATGIFTWVKPKSKFEQDTNRQNQEELNREEMELKQFGPEWKLQQKIKYDFMEFFHAYVNNKARAGNRHLRGSIAQFKLFLSDHKMEKIPIEKLTEEFCINFRTFLLDRFNGKTPGNYFGRFKQTVKAAAKKGYFKNNISPCEDVIVKSNPPSRIKEILTEKEFVRLVQSDCPNHEVKKAFVFSLYTGIRWCDVKMLKWSDIKIHDDYSSFSFLQNKTKVRVEKPLPQTALNFLGEKGEGLLFKLPKSANGCNKCLSKWVNDSGIDRHITWHCARHSYSVLLKTKNVDDATIAGMMGHTSTALVQKTYQRYQMNSAFAAMKQLPFESDNMFVVSNKSADYDAKANLIKVMKDAGFTPEQQIKILTAAELSS